MSKWFNMLRTHPNNEYDFSVTVIDKSSPYFGRKGKIFFGTDDRWLYVTFGGTYNYSRFAPDQLK